MYPYVVPSLLSTDALAKHIDPPRFFLWYVGTTSYMLDEPYVGIAQLKFWTISIELNFPPKKDEWNKHQLNMAIFCE